MLERLETTGEDTTPLYNSNEEIQSDWTRSDTSPCLISADDMGDISHALESILNRKYHDIIQRNVELEKELAEKNNELANKTTLINRLHSDMDQRSLECENYKKVIETLRERCKAYETAEIGHLQSQYKFSIDYTKFDDSATEASIIYVFQIMLELTEEKIEQNKYLIQYSSDVISIYQVLYKDPNIRPEYRYTGNIHDFCINWNTNVVPRIENKERSQQLHLDYGSIKTQYYRSPLKKNEPGLWRKLSEGDKNVGIFKQGVNVKKRLESRLKHLI